MPKPDVSLFDLTERVFQVAVDALFAAWPRPKPEESALRRCRIISHRGEHDNVTVFENTLPAFDMARDHGVWGIECDIRWTKDLVPVVYHDADLRRLSGDSLDTVGSHPTADPTIWPSQITRACLVLLSRWRWGDSPVFLRNNASQLLPRWRFG